MKIKMTHNRERKEASLKVHTLGTRELMGEPIYKRSLDARSRNRAAVRKKNNPYLSGFREFFR